jgi:uncharacterized protein (DUF362 family)
MPKISRAEFLKLAAIVAGGTAGATVLNACGIAPLTGSSAAAFANTPTPASNYPHLSVARGGDTPDLLVRAAIDAIGGMRRFVPSGANVVIKPNLCTLYYDYTHAATTNPFVVGSLVKMCFEAGAASVKVFDHPYAGSSSEAYQSSGMQTEVTATGGELIPVTDRKFVAQALPGAVSLKTTDIFDDALTADVLINVPIAKDHNLTNVTAAMKNMMGAILHRDIIHNDYPDMLTDLNQHLKSTLTVVDAVRILTAHGPASGSYHDVKQANTIIASPDIVAADAFTCVKLFALDLKQSAGYVRRAAERGLGRMDLENLNIKEVSVG